jgi:hypothetical protein
VISGNAIQNVSTVVAKPTVRLANAGSVVVNNCDYSPVGTITNPWPKIGADLTNRVNGGTASRQSGVTYTIRQTPKTVVVSGCNIFRHRGQWSQGTASGAFKLGVEESITFVYQSPPHSGYLLKRVLCASYSAPASATGGERLGSSSYVSSPSSSMKALASRSEIGTVTTHFRRRAPK